MIFKKMCVAVDTILDKIHHHPFNLELSAGTLPKEKYIHYLIQDSLYLADFAKALAITASRLSHNDHVQQYLHFSLETIKAERHHHANHIEKYDGSGLLKKQGPACFMYTNYLLKMASIAHPEEAVASMLPCFWVYGEVGKQIFNQQKINHPYHEWISLYANESFDASVNTAIEITNELGESASASLKEKMISAFVQSTELEWLFWDNAYHQVGFTIGDDRHVSY